MVQAGGCYADNEVPTFRRYNSRGVSYALTQERDNASGYMHPSFDRANHQDSLQDARGQDGTLDKDINIRPRSRVALACQRCRKRKIRCSGDSGGACHNCKTHGLADQCVFLRVLSEDVTMRTDTAVSEVPENNLAASQVHCPIVSPLAHYTQSQTLTPVYGDYRFRDQSSSAYPQPYTIRNFYTGNQPYNDFEPQFDTATQRSLYQVMPASQHQTLSAHSQYMDPSSPSHAWEQVQVPPPNLATNVSTFTNDRLLPFPAVHRPSFQRTNESTFSTLASIDYASFHDNSYTSTCEGHASSSAAQPPMPSVPYKSPLGSQSPESHNHAQLTAPNYRFQQSYHDDDDHCYTQGSAGSYSYGAYNSQYNSTRNNPPFYEISRDSLPTMTEGNTVSSVYPPYQREIRGSYPTPPQNAMIPALIQQRRTSIQSIQ